MRLADGPFQYCGHTHCALSKIVFGSFKLVPSTIVPSSMQDESAKSSKLIRDGMQVSHHRLANIALGGLHLFVVTMVAPTLRASQPLLP